MCYTLHRKRGVKMTRVLQFSTIDREQEYVVFTEDLEADAELHRRSGFGLDSDTILDVTMPDGFPLDDNLDRD